MRALTREECFHLLSTNYIGHIGYLSKGSPEIVPVTYFFDPEQEAVLSYSGEGNKITCMRRNPLISFQVDEIKTLQNWKSVVFHGFFRELQRSEAKILLHVFSRGVKEVIRTKENRSLHYLNEFSSKIDSKDSIVYRLSILEINGRAS